MRHATADDEHVFSGAQVVARERLRVGRCAQDVVGPFVDDGNTGRIDAEASGDALSGEIRRRWRSAPPPSPAALQALVPEAELPGVGFGGCRTRRHRGSPPPARAPPAAAPCCRGSPERRRALPEADRTAPRDGHACRLRRVRSGVRRHRPAWTAVLRQGGGSARMSPATRPAPISASSGATISEEKRCTPVTGCERKTTIDEDWSRHHAS